MSGTDYHIDNIKNIVQLFGFTEEPQKFFDKDIVTDIFWSKVEEVFG